MPARLLSIDDGRRRYAELGVRVTRSQFYRLIRSGAIATVKVGRTYVVDPDEALGAKVQAATAGTVSREARRPAVVPVPAGHELPAVRRPRFGGGAGR